MRGFIKKSFFTIFLLLYSIFLANALPGIFSVIEDFSGEYVFYEDFTFSKKSFIGFLIYDGAISARYFSLDEKNVLEKNIEIIFSFDATPQNDFLDFTGEKILTPIFPGDEEIVNYLHDLIYEFFERRKNENPKFLKTENPLKIVSIEQKFEQFNGDVILTFDPLIPIFNLKSVKTKNGENLFCVLTCGRLNSSGDKSFSNFNGFSQKIKSKKIKKSKIEWTQKMENLWFLGGNAVLSVTKIPIMDDAKKICASLVKRFSLGAEGTFPLWNLQEIDGEIFGISGAKKFFLDSDLKDFERILVKNTVFRYETNTFAKDFKILAKIHGEQEIACLSLTVLEDYFFANEKYFFDILRNFGAKK